MRRSGYTVLTTCSPRNTEYVKAQGADEVFDYNDVDVGLKIRKFTNNRLQLVWDIISTEVSARICATALSSDSKNCRYASFLTNRSPRDDVESIGTNLYTIWGEYFRSGSTQWPASREDFEWGTKFMELTERLLVNDQLKPHNCSVKEGGLHGVLQGLEDLKSNKVSAAKLVYQIAKA